MDGLKFDKDKLRCPDGFESEKNYDSDVVQQCYTCKHLHKDEGDSPCDECFCFLSWEAKK